ncbi:hypothetical protein [Pseudorhodoferax sp.]|uniref:hypothetical protein n=1 Tax=Pseudorhodoferax sp. TaxID=1993553 RepID=UPI002DD69DF0|nr:hypothetical protein [Pseudorhodoferax sp.]
MLLLATALVSAWLLLVRPATDHLHDQVNTKPAAVSIAQQGLGLASTRKPLPSVLRPAAFGPAAADPFSSRQDLTLSAAAPPMPTAPVPPLQAATPAPAPQPSPPPPMPYRFFGRLASPAGELLVFLAKEGQVVQAQTGATFGDGFVVTHVDASAVRLRYVPLAIDHTIALPTFHDPEAAPPR